MATVDEGVWLPWEWKDDLDDFTPITPERLNHMNEGIKRANDACDSLSQLGKLGVSRNTATGVMQLSVTSGDGKATYLALSDSSIYYKNETTGAEKHLDYASWAS